MPADAPASAVAPASHLAPALALIYASRLDEAQEVCRQALDPRWVEIVKKAGLYEAWKKHQ